jgi:hypothetical protein
MRRQMDRNQPLMRNKTIIGTLLLALTLAGIVLVFQSSRRAGTNSSNKECLDASCQKKGNDGKMIWEKPFPPVFLFSVINCRFSPVVVTFHYY